MQFYAKILICFFISLPTFAQRRGQHQELPEKLILQVNASQSSQNAYELPRNAWFKLPTLLTAKKTHSVGSRVKIHYNLRSENDYEFHCYYKSKTQSRKLDFEKCETIDGLEIISNVLDLEGMVFPMDKGSFLKMQIVSSNGKRTKIYAAFLVDWK